MSNTASVRKEGPLDCINVMLNVSDDDDVLVLFVDSWSNSWNRLVSQRKDYFVYQAPSHASRLVLLFIPEIFATFVRCS